MFIESRSVSEEIETVGSKTKNLGRLADFGFPVPPFVAVPSDIVPSVANDAAELRKLCDGIRERFPKNSYAVRSSALAEDQANASMAGQFHTECDVSPARLEVAVSRVIDQSRSKLNGDLSRFSIIVQEYVEAEFSGVCFTRNPNGSREMVLEYHAGIGEDLVGGRIIPTRVSAYWNESLTACGFDAKIFQSVELRFGFPQDIEWCVKNGELIFLQTRPITTVTKSKYREMKYLDETLPPEGEIFLEKTEISEVAPRPTPFTLSLLGKIYGKDGPVMKTYAKCRISFSPQSFLKTVGNELYVDRNLETKTLMPSWKFSGSGHVLDPSGFRSAFRTLGNIFRISAMRQDPKLVARLEASLISTGKTLDFQESLDRFLSDYETIFETNLIAAKYLKNAEVLLKNEKIGFSDLLSTDPSFFSPSLVPAFRYRSEGNLTGNTLEISDEGEFSAASDRSDEAGVSAGVAKWWGAMAEWRRMLYAMPLYNAITYQGYREYARILMVRNLTDLRNHLLDKARLVFHAPRNSYFHTVGEISNGTFDEALCQSRKTEYDSFADFHFPPKLTNRFAPMQAGKSSGLSPGKAEGFLVTETTFRPDDSRPQILYSDTLSPSLTKYFPSICGIVSVHWGFLSHLAIIARERKLPVVVTARPEDARIGEFVIMDGSTGSIVFPKK